MPNAKPKDHYIPQFYLDAFAIEGSGQKNPHIFQYMDEKIASVRIKDVAGEKDYYTFIEKETGASNRDIDSFFTTIEEAAAPGIKKIITEKSFNITPEERKHVSIFLAVLAVRTPGFIKTLQSFYSEATKELHSIEATNPQTFLRKLKEAGVKVEEEELKKIQKFVVDKKYDINFSEDSRGYFLGQGIKQAEIFSRWYYEKHWHIILSENEEIFVTSDNPISVYRPTYIPPVYNAGYGNGTIMLPLSPHVILLMRDIPLKRTIIKANKYFVNKINLNTTMYSDNYIFSKINSEKFQKLFSKTERRVFQKTITTRLNWAPFVFMRPSPAPRELFY